MGKEETDKIDFDRFLTPAPTQKSHLNFSKLTPKPQKEEKIQPASLFKIYRYATFHYRRTQ
jgi:hypothetical protein